MSRFVRASKYRHVFGAPSKRDQCYDNIRVSRSAWDTNLVSANPLFISVNLEASGGGAFAVIPHAAVGKLPENAPVFNGHTGAVLDTDFNPFNDHIIASASEDTKAMVWQIPQNGLTESISTPVLVLAGHGRKVGHVLFNPVADNILATTSADFLVKIWDISKGQEKVELTGHGEIIQSVSWNWTGNLLVTTCKDKKIRVFDVRSNKVVQGATGHQGVKGMRGVWMGSSNKIITTGFSKTSDRQVSVWDSANMSAPLKQEQIDTSSGMLIPFYDADTGILFLAGKGDGNIRYYEWSDDDKGLHYLSEYKSSDPLRGVGFLPKRALTINQTEIARAYKVHPTLVEPISFTVPRKSDGFQSDLFPDTPGPDPAMTADEWLGGKTSPPKLINLEKGFVPAVHAREFSSSAGPTPSDTPVSATMPIIPEKETQELYRQIRKENDELKSALSNKDARIKQLESQLDKLMREKSR